MKTIRLKALLPSVVVCLFLVSVVRATDANPSAEKFFGKITLVNPAAKSLAVHNKKRDSEMQFSWDAQTEFASGNKETIQPSSLAVGQYVAVSYINEGAINKATKVALRPLPFRKKSAK